MIKKFKQKNCEKCEKIFTPRTGTQKYCGSKSLKEGCSWEIKQIRDSSRHLDPKHQEYIKKYQRNWKKEQTKNNTNYIKRLRVSNNKYSRSEKGKQTTKYWRKRNTSKILEWNRKRKLLRRNVKGTHTKKEWETLKKQYEFKCAECSISEKEIEQKWKGTYFTKLTKDHIYPINKGGTDYISNIQPLCISCNAKKKDRIGVIT